MKMRLIQTAMMFFIKYCILGAVYTTLGLVLGAHGLGSSIGIAFSVGGLTSLFAGMLMGEMADRFIIPNKLLFFCHICSMWPRGRLALEIVFSAAKPADFVEVGTGSMDMAGILAEAIKLPSIQHLIIEQDHCSNEETTAAAISLTNLRGIAKALD